MASTSLRTSYRAPLLEVRAGDPFLLAATALAGLALIWVINQIDGTGAIGAAAGPALGAMASLAVILAGPIPCVAAIGGLTAAGVRPQIAEFAGIDITLVDVFFAGLAMWFLWGALGRAQGVFAPRPRVAFGQLAMIVFLVYTGFTLFHIQATDPGELQNAVISWLRLAQTALLAWLVASVVETKRDVSILLSAVAIGCVVAIVVAASGGASVLEERAQGTLGANALGLVSGLLLVIAVFAVPKSRPVARAMLVIAAILGLLLAKSVAAFVAIGIVLAFGFALAREGNVTHRVKRVAIALALAGLLVFSVVSLLRPEAIPGSEEFGNGSAMHRIVAGSAGLEIFENNPLTGVGWRGSNSPRVYADPEVAAAVRRAFPEANPVFYPDVTATSVHNTYIQILADLGIVGFVLFMALIFVLARHTLSLLRRLGRAHELWPAAFTMALGLGLVLVWYNDNPLYGGQPETVLPALFIGALAAMVRLAPPEAAPRPRAGGANAFVAATPTGPLATQPFSRPAPSVRAPTRHVPVLWPGTARRIAFAAGIVAVCSVVGLLAGWWAADDDPHIPVAPAPTAADLADYERLLQREVETLGAVRTAELARLRAAQTPSEQAAAATALSEAHALAADALAAAPAPAAVRRSNQAAIAALSGLSEGYEQLAAAASSEDSALYESARRVVELAEQRLPRGLTIVFDDLSN